MQKNAIILLVFVLLIAVGVALRVLPENTNGQTAATPGEPLRPTAPATFRGFSLQLHNADPEGKTLTLIDEIAQTQANAVCLVIHAYQDNINSTSIFIDARKSPTDEHLGKLIDRAHAKGLKVAIMPVVLLKNKRQNNEWRGRIQPDHWALWWREYRNIILPYARLAQAHDVELFSVGSELLSTEDQAQRWHELIDDVRDVFKGRLTYSANWDKYQAPTWWDRLDIIGMTSYHELSTDSDPSLETLEGAWAPIRQKILAWQKTVNRPILFTEVGWPNQVTAAHYPWNYYAAPDQPAPQLQARLFEAFFRTWGQEPVVAGMMVWEWKWKPDQDTAPQTDTTYCPVDKPAMDIINRFYRQAALAAPSPTRQPQPEAP